MHRSGQKLNAHSATPASLGRLPVIRAAGSTPHAGQAHGKENKTGNNRRGNVTNLWRGTILSNTIYTKERPHVLPVHAVLKKAVHPSITIITKECPHVLEAKAYIAVPASEGSLAGAQRCPHVLPVHATLREAVHKLHLWDIQVDLGTSCTEQKEHLSSGIDQVIHIGREKCAHCRALAVPSWTRRCMVP
eukprot:1158034-Pelagomonas_calceolata.AAC.5